MGDKFSPASLRLIVILVFFFVASVIGILIAGKEIDRPSPAIRDGVRTVVATAMVEASAVMADAEQTGEIEGQLSTTSDLYQQAVSRVFRGKMVTMLVDGSIERDVVFYNELMAEFTDNTGIKVTVEPVTDFENILNERISEGDPPDIAAISSMRLVGELARQGVLVDPKVVLGESTLLQRYDSRWLEMATLPGLDSEITTGIWLDYAPGSIVFYASDDFKKAGYVPPQTWDELVRLSDRIVAKGETPWCIGIEYGPATGWMPSRWLLEIVLRTQPVEVYQQISRGELSFDSPEITQSMDRMARIWFSNAYVYGGSEAITEIDVTQSVAPMFDDPPGCWMHLQSSFIRAYFPKTAVYGKDYDWFLLPTSQEVYGKPQLVGGTLITLFTDRAEVGAVVDYLTRGKLVKPWINEGITLLPHKDTLPEWYKDDFMRSLADGMVKVTAFYPDMAGLWTQKDNENLWSKMSGWVASKQQSWITSESVLATGSQSSKGHIADLIAGGSIAVKPKGSGIDEFELDIWNLLDEFVDVEIPVGTYFVSGSAGVQNMVTLQTVDVQLKPGELLKLFLDAACANMERAVPMNENKFTIQRQADSADLVRLMSVLEDADVPYEVAQAAVWIITDDADYEELGKLVSGFERARLIQEQETAQAMQLVDLAGINITKRRIWANRELIIAGASPELAEWISQR